MSIERQTTCPACAGQLERRDSKSPSGYLQCTNTGCAASYTSIAAYIEQMGPMKLPRCSKCTCRIRFRRQFRISETSSVIGWRCTNKQCRRKGIGHITSYQTLSGAPTAHQVSA